jgi:hypothetical protein
MRAQRRWYQLLFVIGLLGALGAASGAPAFTISSTVGQTGLAATLGPYEIAQSPFDFAGQDFASLTAIAGVSVTLTMTDGDSAPGDFDFGDLTLGLDGVDTGIELNGFQDGATITRTIIGMPNNVAEILANLADGLLAGTVIDADTASVGPSNEITFPASFDATLIISDEPLRPIPVPSTLFLLGSGLAGLAYRRTAKRRSRA